MKDLFRLLLIVVVFAAGNTPPALAGTPVKQLVTATDLLHQQGLSTAAPACTLSPPSTGLTTATDLIMMKHLDIKSDRQVPDPAGEEDDPWDSGEDMGC